MFLQKTLLFCKIWLGQIKIEYGPPGLNPQKRLHLGPKCLPRVVCLWSKMPMFQRVGMREGGMPLPLAFQYLILMIWRPCDLTLVMISSVASKYQDFKVGMPIFQPFYEMKLKTSKYKELASWNQCTAVNRSWPKLNHKVFIS